MTSFPNLVLKVQKDIISVCRKRNVVSLSDFFFEDRFGVECSYLSKHQFDP